MARARNPDRVALLVTALPESTAMHPDRNPGAEEFARRLPGLGLGALRLQLQAVQERLGTAAEQPGDIGHARLLGHEINNRLTATNLERDLRLLADRENLGGSP